MNKLSTERRAAVASALAEGKSIRATVRLTGAAKDTVAKLLVALGAVCTEYQDKTFRNLTCQRVRLDEHWTFVGAKEKSRAKELRGQGRGDVWTWTAMDADSKLLFSWLVGRRELKAAQSFMDDVESRLASRIQFTTDGRAALEKAFGWNGIDYAMLVKEYAAQKGAHQYCPGECISATTTPIIGNPEEKHISTSSVERKNLPIRIQNRRFTRLTNGFSKKVENHEHSIALHFFCYNFCRSHITLTKAKKGVDTTPAMAAGVADHAWKVEELVALLPS